MNVKCSNPSCEHTVPMHMRRQWGGCCSRECQLALTRVIPQPSGGLWVNGSGSVADKRVPVNRKLLNKQNWKGSERE